MNERQEKAIAQLERALAACQKVGLAIYGMDNNLLAYRIEDIEEAKGLAAAEKDRFFIPIEHVDDYRTINDGGAYRDSGGW